MINNSDIYKNNVTFPVLKYEVFTAVKMLCLLSLQCVVLYTDGITPTGLYSSNPGNHN